jgi:hypothetical protein
MSSSFAPGESETALKRNLREEDHTPDTQCDAAAGKKVAQLSRLFKSAASTHQRWHSPFRTKESPESWRARPVEFLLVTLQIKRVI